MPTADARRLLERLRALRASGRPFLFASDFDGTLARIVPVAHEARTSDAVRTAWFALATQNVPLAVATGRRLDDIRARLGSDFPGVVIAEHGAVILRRDGTVHEAAVSNAHRDALAAMDARVRNLAATIPGAIAEHKRYSVALHVRRVSSEHVVAAREALAAVAREAVESGLVIMEGRELLEVRPPLHDKAAALDEVRREVHADAALVYAGDDTTDVTAVQLAARIGIGAWIRSAERAVPDGSDAVAVVTADEWADAVVGLAQGVT